MSSVSKRLETPPRRLGPPHSTGEEQLSTKHEVAVRENYAIAQPGIDIAAVIARNMGGVQITPSDLTRVKVPSGGGTTWEIPTLDGIDESKELIGVIVHTAVQRVYWQQSFEETGGGTPPDCMSFDAVTGNGTPGGLCGLCPLAQFGSDGRAQACQMRHLIFLVRPGKSLLPIVINVPPSSLKAARQYLLGLSGEGQIYTAVETSLTLEKTKNRDGIAYAEIKFRRVGPVEDSEAIERYARDLEPSLRATAQQMASEPMGDRETY